MRDGVTICRKKGDMTKPPEDRIPERKEKVERGLQSLAKKNREKEALDNKEGKKERTGAAKVEKKGVRGAAGSSRGGRALTLNFNGGVVSRQPDLKIAAEKRDKSLHVGLKTKGVTGGNCEEGRNPGRKVDDNPRGGMLTEISLILLSGRGKKEGGEW